MGNTHSTVETENNDDYFNKQLHEFVLLDSSEKRDYLIVLDIDGTLIHRIFNKKRRRKHIAQNPNFSIRNGLYDIYKRPYLDDFLYFLFDRYRVAIWGDAVQWNVDSMTEKLFGTNWQLEFVFSTDHMINRDFKSIDAITKLSNGKWNHTNTIIIDDNISRIYKNSRTNTISIPRYYIQHADWDCTLMLLMKFLKNIDIEKKRDVRLWVKEWYRKNK